MLTASRCGLHAVQRADERLCKGLIYSAQAFICTCARMQARMEAVLPPLPEPMDLGLDESIATDDWLVQDSDAMFTGMTF